MSKHEDERASEDEKAMNRAETFVWGCALAGFSLITWLLTLASPLDGGIFVGLLILGVVVYVGRAYGNRGDPH